MAVHGKFGQLFEEYKAGGITRRQFLGRAAALGVGASLATFVANSHRATGTPAQPRAGFARVHQAGGPPAVGTEGRTRGAGGELRLLQWQAPTTANGHVATGTKDQLAASPVLEPLMNYMPDGSLIPKLITEVPTVENGLLKEDLTGVTFKLQPGVLWSDGTPFTAADVVFTHQWIVTDFDTNSSVSYNVWLPIETITATDETTVDVTFANPNVVWYAPFTGTTYGFILPKHVLEAGPEAAAAFQTAPIGTGPYVVESFAPNDQVVYRANPNYREPTKPFFETINLKGGGDAASAARAVLQTGDWDYAWNLQVEPAILNELLESGDKGSIQLMPGTLIERLNINFSDPNKEVNGERSQKDRRWPSPPIAKPSPPSSTAPASRARPTSWPGSRPGTRRIPPTPLTWSRRSRSSKMLAG
jgi:peptide/nickel transport system substrate-binding protein